MRTSPRIADQRLLVPAVYRKAQEEVKADHRLTIECMVELGRVSGSAFYRFDDAEPGPDRDMKLCDAIQKIAVEWPCYGRPRVTEELRRREWVVNPKRVRRLMRRTTCCTCGNGSS